MEGLDYRDWARARDRDENPSHSANRPPPPIHLPQNFIPPNEVQLNTPWGCCLEDDPSAQNNVPRTKKKAAQKKRKKAKAEGKEANPSSSTERNPVSLLYKFTKAIPEDVKVHHSLPMLYLN